jgi:succinyl-CoA synthetase beta subunit
MSRKSKAKDQTKALNIPFTLTQADLVQEALAVAKDQTQALNIPVKVPLGGGRYAELLEILPDVNCQLRGFDDDVDVFSQVISPVHGFSVFHSTDQIVHHLCSTAQDFPLW